MKKFYWKDYLSFSKKERNTSLMILFVVGLVTIASIYFQSKEDETYVTKQFVDELNDSANSLVYTNDSGIANQSYHPKSFYKNAVDEKNLFVFDPNILDETGWKKLGLNDKTIHTIINYRNKGGKFYKPEDIKKIYGIGQENAEKLIPFIRIESVNNHAFDNKRYNDKNKILNYPKKQFHTIDINTATEEEWKSLPGIGDVLSKRIVKFRNSKGSFTSVEEVAKTYGLKDSIFQIIKPYLRMSASE